MGLHKPTLDIVRRGWMRTDIGSVQTIYRSDGSEKPTKRTAEVYFKPSGEKKREPVGTPIELQRRVIVLGILPVWGYVPNAKNELKELQREAKRKVREAKEAAKPADKETQGSRKLERV